MAASRTSGVLRYLGFLFVAGVLPLGVCLENVNQGPYTTWFNQRLTAKATSAALIGQPEAAVEGVLGSASEIATYEHETRSAIDGGVEVIGPAARTFNYYPLPFVPFSKFQVHCHNGVVTGLEVFDD